jgi:hypothetical protein
LLQFHSVATNKPGSIEIPVMVDKAVITKHDGRVVKTRSGSAFYMIKNGSRHVFLNRTSIPLDLVDILVDDHQLYSISIGNPIK